MLSANTQTAPSKAGLYTGYTLTVLATLFLLMDAGMKFTHAAPVIEANNQLGIPMSLTPSIGIIALACLALYVLPATSILGAVLFTGYLGGAVAVHARVGNPIFTHLLFPIYISLFLWGGIWLRNRSLRELFPFVRDPASSAPSKALLSIGYLITGLAALFILFSAVMKFLYTPPAGAPPPSFPLEHLHTLGILEILLVALYLIPRTSFLGTVLLTGYLGGATIINLRGGESVALSLIPVIAGIALWAGLWLRNARVRSLIPLRNK